MSSATDWHAEDYEALFDADLTPAADAVARLRRVAEAGRPIRITGDMTRYPWFRAALRAALYDHEIPFTEIENE